MAIIFKEGDKCDISNYRAIPVLPVISRLIEKLIFNQLYQMDWYTRLDSCQMLGMIITDLRMVFDIVDYRVNSNRLKLHGVQ